MTREILAFCQTKKRRSTKQLFSKASEPLEKPFSFNKRLRVLASNKALDAFVKPASEERS